MTGDRKKENFSRFVRTFELFFNKRCDSAHTKQELKRFFQTMIDNSNRRFRHGKFTTMVKMAAKERAIQSMKQSWIEEEWASTDEAPLQKNEKRKKPLMLRKEKHFGHLITYWTSAPPSSNSLSLSLSGNGISNTSPFTFPFDHFVEATVAQATMITCQQQNSRQIAQTHTTINPFILNIVVISCWYWIWIWSRLTVRWRIQMQEDHGS